MPEISALPVASALPTTAGVGGATPQAPRDASGAPADSSAPSFMSQLQSALTSLGLLAPASPTAGATTTAPVQDDDAASVATARDGDDADEADTTDILPEVLAALGFVPVPAQLPLLTLTPDTTVAESVASVGPSALGSLKTLAPLVQGPVPSDQQASDAATTSDPGRATIAAPTTPAAQPVNPAADALLNQMQPVMPQAQPSIDPRLLAQPHTSVAAGQGEHAPESKAVEPTSPSAVVTQPIQAVQTTSAQTTTDSDSDGDSKPSSGESVQASDATAARTEAPTQTFATVAHTATHRVETSSDVKSARVVSQIAHQADLYRLPGGRGVRIQLHPDDLGGVGVTIKYGATGGLELHVTAEHAATAELVQAGWNDLRDALSLQGIAPERLIMSVSGPSGADLSNSQGGSYRSNAGAAGFGFGQDSSPQRDGNNNESRASGGWSGFDDAPGASVDDVRPSSAVSNSRIDYRV